MKSNDIKNKPGFDLLNTRTRRQNKLRHTSNYNIAKADKAKDLYLFGVPVKIICRELYIARSTLYNYLKKEGVDPYSYKCSAKIKYSHN